MEIHLDAALEELQGKKTGMDAYSEIMDTFRDTDISTDAQFRKCFTCFYKVRRNAAWRQFFYRYFEEIKNRENVEFAEIITKIYEETGRVEASFSSKLLATLDSNMPIIDRLVLEKLGQKMSGKSAEEKLARAIAIHGQLVQWYQAFLETEEAQRYIGQFDVHFPEHRGFSATKKIGFLIWADRGAAVD